ncbi:MAG: hypothetical protein ACE5ES_01220 [Candidatus Nanoarchaeia archaeon]
MIKNERRIFNSNLPGDEKKEAYREIDRRVRNYERDMDSYLRAERFLEKGIESSPDFKRLIDKMGKIINEGVRFLEELLKPEESGRSLVVLKRKFELGPGEYGYPSIN